MKWLKALIARPRILLSTSQEKYDFDEEKYSFYMEEYRNAQGQVNHIISHSSENERTRLPIACERVIKTIEQASQEFPRHGELEIFYLSALHEKAMLILGRQVSKVVNEIYRPAYGNLTLSEFQEVSRLINSYLNYVPKTKYSIGNEGEKYEMYRYRAMAYLDHNIATKAIEELETTVHLFGKCDYKLKVCAHIELKQFEMALESVNQLIISIGEPRFGGAWGDLIWAYERRSRIYNELGNQQASQRDKHRAEEMILQNRRF